MEHAPLNTTTPDEMTTWKVGPGCALKERRGTYYAWFYDRTYGEKWVSLRTDDRAAAWERVRDRQRVRIRQTT